MNRDAVDEVKSTVLFRPENAKLSDDDKDNMKLLNVCAPYVHEFFFDGRIIVVEGDTEYTAFSQLKLLYPGEYDADTKLTSKSTGNPAWTVNTRILAEINNSSDISNTVEYSNAIVHHFC